MKIIITLFIHFTCLYCHCQGSIVPFNQMKPAKDFDNIVVQKIATNKNSTTFAIWIKQSVRLHKHINHVENVYISEGHGEFQLGDSIYNVKNGDLIVIPKDTWHGVKVNSNNPMKVISVQSPEFFGKDRVFKEN